MSSRSSSYSAVGVGWKVKSLLEGANVGSVVVTGLFVNIKKVGVGAMVGGAEVGTSVGVLVGGDEVIGA